MRQLVKFGAAGVIGLATTGVSAQAMAASLGDHSDFLMLDEVPLSEPELQEARGGFNIGGFEFDFSIDIGPIDIDDPLPDNMFGEDGVFGDDGLFGDDGVFGEDGVFGDDAPGTETPATATPATDTPPPGDTTTTIIVATPEQPAANTGAPDVGAEVAATTPTTQSSSSPPAPTQVDTAQQQPPQQETPQIASAPPPTSQPEAPQSPPSGETTVAQAPPPEQPAPATASQGQQPGQQGDTVLTQPSANTNSAPPANDNGQANTNAPPAPAPNNGPSDGGAVIAHQPEDEPDVAMSFSTGNNSVATVTQSVDTNGGGTTLVFNNAMDGAFLRHTIDINVAIPNFDQRIDMAIAQTVTSTITSTYGLIGAFN